ncbi:MAG: hypothetical protein ACM3QZ_00445 [Solirubrobacterales bacterium]
MVKAGLAEANMRKRGIALVFLLIVGLLLVAGCNPIARKYGGRVTSKLPENQKLVNVTWKEDSLWLLTRPMRPGEKPETYTFREDSTFGVLEGKVIIVERVSEE